MVSFKVAELDLVLDRDKPMDIGNINYEALIAIPFYHLAIIVSNIHYYVITKFSTSDVELLDLPHFFDWQQRSIQSDSEVSGFPAASDLVARCVSSEKNM